MKEILVSIVCTNYNKGDWIAEAIESFLRQKANFEYEILLIDDKSVDHSPEIIKKYAKKYPDKVRAFYNEKNLGITKTWIKVCEEARGKYIARCDGDDYWIDDNKLQRQVDELEKNKNSLWCNTDYNVINSAGETIKRSAFKNGVVKSVNTYAEMLATKGFTAPSTWLVKASLMKNINAQIDKNAIDDTFNIQLDLFHKTKLTHLSTSTAVYRENEGSDAHPVEMEAILSRHRKLLETQLKYIEKYKNANYNDVLKILLRRDMENEVLSMERLRVIQETQHYARELEESIRTTKESKSYQFLALVRKIVNIPIKFMRRKH